MKKTNRTKVAAISAIAVFVIGLSALGITQVYAQSNGNPISGLARAIAQKFNPDPNQVQTTITDYRQQNRQTNLQNHSKINFQLGNFRLIIFLPPTKRGKTKVRAEYK